MRLIDVKTLQLKEFYHNIPKYAILSHTWGNEEVTFQDYLFVTDASSHPHAYSRINEIKRRAGFTKIIGACKRAQADKLAYLWCDTNCIDKTSSAELSEAINSMYAWYRNSAICYAYLADVRLEWGASALSGELRNSRWFTRGWTLQELLAPEKVVFFNASWMALADRQQLADVIHDITRIHVGALRDWNTIQDYSVAQRMSWAAGRQTTREEDIAYSLLGIFDINMPLLYGEGMNAFTRLQEEIIKVSDDQSILAWDFLGGEQQSPVGILASSPCDFASCGSIVRDLSAIRWPYSSTNRGVSLQLPMIQTCVNKTVLVGLNCSIELHGGQSLGDAQTAKLPGRRFPVWIWLRSVGQSIYTRSPCPTSRALLARFYPDKVQCAVTRLFGTTSGPKAEFRIPVIFPSTYNNGAMSTGFHVTIGFGRIRPQTKTFQDAFLPGDFKIHQISPRGSPALSHEIILAGSYAVLLSIAWDQQQQQPVYWRHGTFIGLNTTAFRTLRADDWDILFRNPQKSSTEENNNVGRIEYIHDQIGKLLVQSTSSTEGGLLPIVNMEKDLWYDHHGQAKVVVHLVFQEVTASQYRP
ncbi:HET-domain-containing protein [Xylaria sp. FL0064]|nr:HET-domain-containing protein [Xylaria sp. FL0064]